MIERNWCKPVVPADTAAAGAAFRSSAQMQVVRTLKRNGNARTPELSAKQECEIASSGEKQPTSSRQQHTCDVFLVLVVDFPVVREQLHKLRVAHVERQRLLLHAQQSSERRQNGVSNTAQIARRNCKPSERK